jgi:hypothetical protein
MYPVPNRKLESGSTFFTHVNCWLRITIRGAELMSVDQRAAKIERTLQQLANVLVLTAWQDERFISIERRVDRLELSSPVRHQ